MFDKKQKTLIEKPKVTTVSAKASNPFVDSAFQKSVTTRSANGALKYTSTGNTLVDQFSSTVLYKKPRATKDIFEDTLKLWSEDALNSVKFTLYLRTVTRKTQIAGRTTAESQIGQGLKHEAIMRMIWLHTAYPETFWKNVTLLIALGSWKDIFQMLSYDLEYNGWNGRVLNWTKFGDLILSGLQDPNNMNLVKKYLPQIKTLKKCTTLQSQADTIIAKWICSLLFGSKIDSDNSGSTYRKYRKLKTSGTAHEWQKLISQRKFTAIEFDKIHGRALNLLVRSKFLKNQNLSERYSQWIASKQKEGASVKYTGYSHELFSEYIGLPISNNYHEHYVKYKSFSSVPTEIRMTIDSQFQTLVEKGKKDDTGRLNKFIVVRDTSGSMLSPASGSKMSCFAVAKALGLYFAELIDSEYFKDTYIEFSNVATLRKYSGKTPTEKWFNDTHNYVGSTNFLGVIDLFIDIKKKGVKESDFPTGIVCISDNEFNSSPDNQKTNMETAKTKLLAAGFSREFVEEFVVVLWNINARRSIYETSTANTSNIFYVSGYDGAAINFITSGNIKTSEDMALEALNQELLNLVEI